MLDYPVAEFWRAFVFIVIGGAVALGLLAWWLTRWWKRQKLDGSPRLIEPRCPRCLALVKSGDPECVWCGNSLEAAP